MKSDTPVLRAEDFAMEITAKNDAFGRMGISLDAVHALRQL